MKSKNLVSLSVSAAFAVLSITGLLIYFGQSSHVVDHVHAWFGILFVSAAIFHIINNWSSIKGYSKDRRTGGIRRELIIPALLAIVFTAGIAADLPVFKGLANAGKNLVRGDKPRKGGPLSPAAVDSIAYSVETQYSAALSNVDTAALAKTFTDHATVGTEAGTFMSGAEAVKKAGETEKLTTKIDHATALDDNVIVVHGTAIPAARTPAAFTFTRVLKHEGDRWLIAAVQMTRLPAAKTAVASR